MADEFTLQIRVAHRQDLPHILDLYTRSGVDSLVLDLPAAEALFERIRGYPRYGMYVALADGRVVGTFALLIMDNLVHLGSPSGIVEAVAVDPVWHGRKIGTRMMQEALRLCRAAGCYKVALSAHLERVKAHRFYESLGFERHGFSFTINLENVGS